MTIFNSISDYTNPKKAIVTIGTFDGVHLGHQKIIKKLVQTAKDFNCESLILTFFPHPRMVLSHDSTIELLNTIDEKSELLKDFGVQNLIIHPFDKEFSELSAEDFVVKVLIEKLNTKKIIIGYDHRFGKNRSANIDDLILFGKKYNFEVEQISAQEINEVAISSTKIRKALLDDSISIANQNLGYNYIISGKVVKGKQLGRTIGFPTANIKIEENYKLIPKNGVYIIQSVIENKNYFGLMNIGIRPTIDGTSKTIEVYFLDFDKDIYNQYLKIELISNIRDEKKFDSLEELKIQIEKDRQTALEFIKKQNQ